MDSDENSLDLNDDVKPILSIPLIPLNEEVVEIDLENVKTINKIFGGDFNCICNPNIDKIDGNINRGKIGYENLKIIIYDFELFDVFKFFKPNDVNVTWRSKYTSCRLDRLYFSNCIKPLK